MGMRAQSIERAIRQRPNQAETFEEMGRRPQLSGGEMTSLASALSGMSSGAGTYRGVSPRNVGFQEALTAIERDRLQEEQRLMDDIKLAGLADEERAREARRAKPLDAFQRNLFQQRLAELPGGEGIELPTDMTFGQIEDDPILSQVFADLIPRTKGAPSARDEILRNQELMRQKRLKQPVSEIDRKFLNKKLQEAGIDKTLPTDYTYGDVEGNMFFSQFKGKLKGDGGADGLTAAEARAERLKLQREQFEERRKRMQQQEERAEKKESRGSATQNIVATYADRIEEAEKVFDELDASGFDRSQLKYGLFSQFPDVVISRLPNGDKLLRQKQAERNFVSAVLRRESGAAIAESEFQNAEQQYFPRAGDSPELIQQKKRNRELVLQGFQREAGPILEQKAKTERREWTP